MNSKNVSRKSNSVRNQSGQTLIEYLIIVALVGVGSIALMRAVSQNINVRFSQVVRGLGGSVAQVSDKGEVSAAMMKQRDWKNFSHGANENKSRSNDSGE